MAIRQSGEIIMRFIVNWPIRPSRKHPVKLISKVPEGKVPPVRACTRPCKPYRANVPIAPKTAINVSRKFAPIPYSRNTGDPVHDQKGGPPYRAQHFCALARQPSQKWPTM